MLSFDTTTDSMSFSPWSMPQSMMTKAPQHQPQQSLLQDLYDPAPSSSADYYSQYYHNVPIKLEESTIMVPSQPVAYSPYHQQQHQQQQQQQQHQHQQQHAHHHQLPLPNGGHHHHHLHHAQHPGAHLSVQHTDDAASKETQYLRRRCFNCHTTEPPSWRRSTLNPGKIVCNKCGLYERTHLRPRPLRFDELRSGGKPRKSANPGPGPGGAGGLQKKAKLTNGLATGSLVRRSSVSSNSSVHSSSDWDDSISVYSTGSGSIPTSSSSPPTTTNGSPQLALSLPIEIHLQPPIPPLSTSSSSSSPNLSNNNNNNIRLPGNPLIDLSGSYIPRKSHTSPTATAASSSSGMYTPPPNSGSPSLASTPSLSASSTPPLGSLGRPWTTEPEDIGLGLAFSYSHTHHHHGHPLGAYTNGNNGLRRSQSGSPR